MVLFLRSLRQTADIEFVGGKSWGQPVGIVQLVVAGGLLCLKS